MSDLRTLLKTRLQTATDDTLREAVTYTPNGGADRPILATIQRDGPDDYGHSNTPMVTVRVDNDAVTGITPAELDEANDVITMAMEPGGAITDRQIKRIVRQSAVRLILEVT